MSYKWTAARHGSAEASPSRSWKHDPFPRAYTPSNSVEAHGGEPVEPRLRLGGAAEAGEAFSPGDEDLPVGQRAPAGGEHRERPFPGLPRLVPVAERRRDPAAEDLGLGDQPPGPLVRLALQQGVQDGERFPHLGAGSPPFGVAESREGGGGAAAG